MGTWSISPSSSLATIDQTGKVVFKAHSAMTSYTLTYTPGAGETCSGATSKSVVIFPCD